MDELEELRKELNEIERLLAMKLPETLQSLRPPATATELDQLSSMSGIPKLPPEVLVLYGWHDGQRGNTFSPLDNRMLLSISEAVETYRFLHSDEEDIDLPPPRSWWPLFENGGGDNLMFETEGPSRGSLFPYWHDWDDREVEADSLREYLGQARVAIEEWERPSAIESLDMSMCAISLTAEEQISDLGFLRAVQTVSGVPLQQVRQFLMHPGREPFLQINLSKLNGEFVRSSTGTEVIRLLRQADTLSAKVHMYITPLAEWIPGKVSSGHEVERELFERMVRR